MVIAISGRKGDALNLFLKETDIAICVQSQSAARILEVQILITHCLLDLIDHQLFGG
jgi:D-sedoheptulose 7-phosphate isomerase